MKYKITVSERKVYEYEVEGSSKARAKLGAMREYITQKDFLEPVKEFWSLDYIHLVEEDMS